MILSSQFFEPIYDAANESTWFILPKNEVNDFRISIRDLSLKTTIEDDGSFCMYSVLRISLSQNEFDEVLKRPLMEWHESHSR